MVIALYHGKRRSVSREKSTSVDSTKGGEGRQQSEKYWSLSRKRHEEGAASEKAHELIARLVSRGKGRWSAHPTPIPPKSSRGGEEEVPTITGEGGISAFQVRPCPVGGKLVGYLLGGKSATSGKWKSTNRRGGRGGAPCEEKGIHPK